MSSAALTCSVAGGAQALKHLYLVVRGYWSCRADDARRWFDLAGTSEEDQTIGGLYRRESARVAGEPGPGGGGTNG